MSRHYLTCAEADSLRPALVPVSSLTNYIGGEHIDPRLPAITATTWAPPPYTDYPTMHEELDADGCRHWIEVTE